MKTPANLKKETAGPDGFAGPATYQDLHLNGKNRPPRVGGRGGLRDFWSPGRCARHRPDGAFSRPEFLPTWMETGGRSGCGSPLLAGRGRGGPARRAPVPRPVLRGEPVGAIAQSKGCT